MVQGELMRSAVGALGLLLATVFGLLSLTQFSAIESSLEALTSGTLTTYISNFQFFGVLLVVLIALIPMLDKARLERVGGGFRE